MLDVVPRVETWGTILAIDSLRYAVPAALAFTVFWMWKWDALAHRRIQRRRPSRRAFTREVRYSALTALIFATVGYTMFAVGLRTTPHVESWAWWFASIVLAIVVHDTYFYWTHRAMHHPRLFHLVHRAHHLSTSPSPWAAYAFGPIEAFVAALIAPIVLLLIPIHASAFFIFLAYMIVMNVIGHLGIELYPPWFARSGWTGWYSTSTHHNLHHRDFRGNYGLYFTWWDRLMGTQHPDYQATFAEITDRASSRAT